MLFLTPNQKCGSTEGNAINTASKFHIKEVQLQYIECVQCTTDEMLMLGNWMYFLIKTKLVWRNS